MKKIIIKIGVVAVLLSGVTPLFDEDLPDPVSPKKNIFMNIE